jgi:hypothetical protein
VKLPISTDAWTITSPLALEARSGQEKEKYSRRVPRS